MLYYTILYKNYFYFVIYNTISLILSILILISFNRCWLKDFVKKILLKLDNGILKQFQVKWSAVVKLHRTRVSLCHNTWCIQILWKWQTRTCLDSIMCQSRKKIRNLIFAIQIFSLVNRDASTVWKAKSIYISHDMRTERNHAIIQVPTLYGVLRIMKKLKVHLLCWT